jgi:hypothetical protein
VRARPRVAIVTAVAPAGDIAADHGTRVYD